MKELQNIKRLYLLGTAINKASVLSFKLDGYSDDEVGERLNSYGVVVRTGHHCAQPVLRRFGYESAVRPILAIEVFTVATEGAFAPYNYINDKGEPDGYDVAIEFKIQPVEWSSIFVGFETGRYDVIVSQIAKTPTREERYLYSNIPYSWEAGAIAYLKGR